MNKLSVICGLTATGKTSLALKLAEKFNGELVSADSRQIYKGIDIGTGKDIPRGSQWELSKLPNSNDQFPIGFWETKKRIKIWGYDLVEPTKEFDVSEYVTIARNIINDIWSRNKLPIVVGGTGFYIKGVIDGIGTVGVKKDEKLRKTLESKSVKKLFEILQKFDPKRAKSLNTSDKNNPRRLIRAIEIAKNIKEVSSREKIGLDADVMCIGLRISKDELSNKIKRRVEVRMKSGLVDEIKDLLSAGVKWSDQSMTATGYRQMKGYFDENKNLKECKKEWILTETQYTKRQMTWFKKDKKIMWFDVADPDHDQKIEKIVSRWYFNR